MKRGVKILIAVLLLIAAVLAVNSHVVWLTAVNLFQPRLKLDESTEWSGGKTYEKVSYGEDESQYVDLYVPDSEETVPLFVLVHGGGFVTGDSQTRQAQFMYRYFRDHGFACASVNYRLAGEAVFPGAVDDVKSAVKFLTEHAEEYGYSAEKIAIWGESAGSYLASREALTDADANIYALVAYYGTAERIQSKEMFSELGIPQWMVKIGGGWVTKLCEGYGSCEEFWLRKEYAEWTQEDYDAMSIPVQMEKAGKLRDLKVLLYHGDADITVPQTQSALLRDKAAEIYGEDSAQVEYFHGYIHAADRFYSDEQLAEVEAFVRSALGIA